MLYHYPLCIIPLVQVIHHWFTKTFWQLSLGFLWNFFHTIIFKLKVFQASKQAELILILWCKRVCLFVPAGDRGTSEVVTTTLP